LVKAPTIRIPRVKDSDDMARVVIVSNGLRLGGCVSFRCGKKVEMLAVGPPSFISQSVSARDWIIRHG
jgi:hypothetical protein